jgi:hypothetical protein
MLYIFPLVLSLLKIMLHVFDPEPRCSIFIHGLPLYLANGPVLTFTPCSYWSTTKETRKLFDNKWTDTKKLNQQDVARKSILLILCLSQKSHWKPHGVCLFT